MLNLRANSLKWGKQKSNFLRVGMAMLFFRQYLTFSNLALRPVNLSVPNGMTMRDTAATCNAFTTSFIYKKSKIYN